MSVGSSSSSAGAALSGDSASSSVSSEFLSSISALFSSSSSSLVYLVIFTVSLLLVYRFYLTRPFRKIPRQHFDKRSQAFEFQRRSAFPPPYPNGWWKLCDVKDLDNGRIQSVTTCGVDFVVFKNDKGEVGVLEAFCPHLGAHLGDGEVVNGQIKCPFHGWQMDVNGTCQHIPYCDSTIPATAKAKTYTHRIWLKMVFVWYHCDGAEPMYELEPRKEMEEKWLRFGTVQSDYSMHISEMAENSADYFHFNYLHAPLPIPIIGRLFRVHYETKLYFSENPEDKHKCYFDNWALVWFLDRFPMPFTRQLTKVTFEGPSIVHFDITTPLGTLHLVKTNIPLKPFHVYSEDTWFYEPRTPRWLVAIVTSIAKGALEQDRTVWESRRYTMKPNLVKGDGPFPAHRRWWRQFYSENSKKVAYEKEKISLDW